MNDKAAQPELEQLSAYLDGELDAARMAEVQALLERRPDLQRQLEQMRWLDAMLDQYKAPAPSAELSMRIIRSARAADRPGVIQLGRYLRPLAAAAAAAVVLAVVVTQPWKGPIDPDKNANAPGRPRIDLPADDDVEEQLAGLAVEDRFIVENLAFFRDYSLAGQLAEANIDSATLDAMDRLERKGEY